MVNKVMCDKPHIWTRRQYLFPVTCRQHLTWKVCSWLINTVSCNLDISRWRCLSDVGACCNWPCDWHVTAGDCWFIAAVTCLAVSPAELFRRVVPLNQHFHENYAGKKTMFLIHTVMLPEEGHGRPNSWEKFSFQFSVTFCPHKKTKIVSTRHFPCLKLY